ncbi:MAG: 2,3-bisphosphoglycerate-independent phosphoglycerate mutase [Betaproteobacteria bacterium]|nr:2,3-bisphosphoglycerate-independent phosphoglycerate mutase [Betaproteobacteria bacterium]
MPVTPPVVPVILLILDGFGHREATPDNAISAAHAPHWRELWEHSPHTLIEASELHVGLPDGQMGNSEVGHLNIGAGRVVYQDYTRIDQAIKTGEFAANPALAGALRLAREGRGRLHVLGLLSPGGVHSHERHILALLELAAREGVPHTFMHAFLDGRDTPPQSAGASLERLASACNRHPGCRVVSICGRYYAMDRDQRWERVAQAYTLLTQGEAPYSAPNPTQGLAEAYARGESDEFVKPTAILAPDGSRVHIEDGDVVVFMNFRADRAREITRALTADHFEGFERRLRPKLAQLVCLTSYGDEFPDLPVAFAPQSIANSFGEYLAGLGLKQLRIAETEKYAHVTYFFNGGSEAAYTGEDRVLVPSPKVATYDLKPEMSAYEVTDKLVEAIHSRRYAAVICNYANGDMVGHTGILPAAIKAVEALDVCLGRVLEAARQAGYEVLITADHGNAEMMFDPATGQPHTAHTLNPVPFIYLGRPARLKDGGALQDIAPTLLDMMGLPQPPEMTGHSLIAWQ